ncbi:unnamed protein product, partial [Ectocarpus fasciculatus]
EHEVTRCFCVVAFITFTNALRFFLGARLVLGPGLRLAAVVVVLWLHINNRRSDLSIQYLLLPVPILTLDAADSRGHRLPYPNKVFLKIKWTANPAKINDRLSFSFLF